MLRRVVSSRAACIAARARTAAATAATAAATGASDVLGPVYVSPHPSVLRGAGVAPLEPTLYDWYQARASRRPEATAFVCGTTGRVVTFADTLRLTSRLASLLHHKFGVRSGDVVAVLSPNSVEYLSIVQAILALGAVVTPANPLYTAEELARQLTLANASALITTSLFEATANAAAALAMAKYNANVNNNANNNNANTTPKPPLRKVQVLLADRVAQMPDAAPLPSGGLHQTRALDDAAILPASSGTTGQQKVVELSHRNVLTNIRQTQQSLCVDCRDVALGVLPYFHIYGLTVVLFGMVNVGAAQVAIPKFDLAQYLAHIAAHRATLLFVAPPIVVGLLKSPATRETPRDSVRLIMCGAAPLARDVQIACEQLFPTAALVQGYGLSETSPVLTIGEKGLYGSAGILVADTEARILRIANLLEADGADASSGVDVPLGEEGELAVRGDQVMKGYLSADDTARVMLPGGWFRTGDIARFDNNGRALVIVDRLKELIKYKGFQVAPAELEGVLLTSPWVLDCVVVGVPAPNLPGCEVPRAQVVLRKDLSDAERAAAPAKIVEFVQERVAPHKKLRGGVQVVDAVPKNASGKLLRRVAKQQEIARLAEQEKAAAASPS